MEIKIETKPSQLCKGFPKEFEEYVEYTRNLEYEQDPDYDYLKNLFYIILKDNKNNSEILYDWDIGNKVLNSITLTNTSQKTFMIKKRNTDKKDNIIFKNKNFTKIQKVLNNGKKEFEERKNIKIKDKIKENKSSIDVIKANEKYNKTQIIHYNKSRNKNNKERNIVNFKTKNVSEIKKIDNIDNIDIEFENIMELTDEGKDKNINKCPNVFSLIHNKSELEKNNNNNSRKINDDNGCNII